VADLVEQIMASCPTVTVLATSREPVGVTGERVWGVPSLAPAREGVELFCDRAADADAAFVATAADQAVIAGICERLDGIPLAIELAAARIRSMTPGDLADRLQDRFRLLRGGRRGVERHQTLRAAVLWSYQLLSRVEQALFDRLSVFAGTFDLAAVEGVCVGGEVGDGDIDDLMGSLVDKSMVVVDRSGPHIRCSLFETLRQFSEERLTERDAAGLYRDRHLAYYVSFAEAARNQRRHRPRGSRSRRHGRRPVIRCAPPRRACGR
jgi:predicted ATPase